MLGCECFCDFGFGVNLAPACLCGESERLRINTVSVTARPLLAVELCATCGTPAESKLVPPRFRRFKRRWLDLFAYWLVLLWSSGAGFKHRLVKLLVG